MKKKIKRRRGREENQGKNKQHIDTTKLSNVQLIILKTVALFHEQAMKMYLQKHIYLNLNSTVKPKTPGFPPTTASECLFTEHFRYSRHLRRHV